MENLAFKIQKNLQTITSDLDILMNDLKNCENKPTYDLNYAAKVYREIVDCLCNELLFVSHSPASSHDAGGNVVDSGNLKRHFDLLRWELSRRQPEWIVLGQTSTSIRLVRVSNENGLIGRDIHNSGVQLDSQVIISVIPSRLPSSCRRVPIQIRSGNLNVKLDVVKISFVSRMLLLLRALLPSSVVLDRWHSEVVECMQPAMVKDKESSVLVADKGRLTVADKEKPFFGTWKGHFPDVKPYFEPSKHVKAEDGDGEMGCQSEDDPEKVMRTIAGRVPQIRRHSSGGEEDFSIDAFDDDDDYVVAVNEYVGFGDAAQENVPANEPLCRSVESIRTAQSARDSIDSSLELKHPPIDVRDEIAVKEINQKVEKKVRLKKVCKNRPNGKTPSAHKIRIRFTANRKTGANLPYYLPCHRCKKVYNSWLIAKNHLKTDHGVEEDVCVTCPNREFVDASDRRYHYSVCHNPTLNRCRRTQPCKKCSVPLSRTQGWTHMGIEHSKPNECPFCPFNASNMDLSNINSLVSDISTKAPDLLAKMRQHIRLEHPMDDPQLFLCCCKKTFPTKAQLKEHNSTKIPDAERTVPICKRLLVEEPKVVCGHCGLSFCKSYFKKHSAIEHGINVAETFKYPCSECPKRFQHLYLLRGHLLQEHFPDKRDHVCHVCSKTFSSNVTFKEHVGRHSSKKLKCPQCPKSFNSPNNVRQHLRGCHYPPSYECTLCGQKYHHRAMLNTHLKNVHQVVAGNSFIKKHKVDMTADVMQIGKLLVDVAGVDSES